VGSHSIPNTGWCSAQLGEEAASGKGSCRAEYFMKRDWGEERQTLAETGGAVHP